MRDERVTQVTLRPSSLVSSLSLQPLFFPTHPTCTDFQLLYNALAAIMLAKSQSGEVSHDFISTYPALSRIDSRCSCVFRARSGSAHSRTAPQSKGERDADHWRNRRDD